MKKIAVLFANGTEEIESLACVDIFRRCNGAMCDIVSVNGEFPVGSHAITIKADKTVHEADFGAYDAIVIPGGMPGATNIANNNVVINAISKALSENRVVGAICASPAVILANAGLIKGKKVTCYPAPAFIKMLDNNVYTKEAVTVDGNLITANGPKSAIEFALAICKKLELTPNF